MKPGRLATLTASLLLLLLLLGMAASLPGGAPPGVCDTMTPVHRGIKAQSSQSPYQLFVSQGSGKLHVFMGSEQGEGYQGFLLLARDLDTGAVVGEWAEPSSNASRWLECAHGGPKNAMTQTKPSKYHNLEFDWIPAADYEGQIKFNATLLKDFETFWVGVESPRISVSKRSITVHTTTPDPTFLNVGPRSTTPPYFSPTPNGLDTRVQHPIYEGCGSNKICFGAPNKCVEEKSCTSMVTVLVEGERYIFEMQTLVGKWVAVGLSDDEKMGDDSVVECVNKNGDEVTIHMSWNTPNKKNNRHPTPANAISLMSKSVMDGAITCKFSRNKTTRVENRDFDLETRPYHLLLAAGNGVNENSVGYHDVLFIAAGERKLLSDVSALSSSSDILIRLHGALMLASWVGTASVGMLLARYYRQTWVNSQFCGKDQWFAWHRVFMLLTWVMTLAAAVLIFVELGEWSSATYHASFGLATVVLCFVQPFMAGLRPHPGASKRALFNWAHWFVGNAAHICGIIALFLASGLAKAKLPEWIDWVLVAYVAFHVLTHFFLTFAGCASDKQGSQRVNSFPMKDVHARNSMTHPDTRRDAPHSGLRKATFLIYFLGVAALVAALVIVIVFAPIEDSWNSWLDTKTF